MEPTECPRCLGRRHLKTDEGWVRCPCLEAYLDDAFILPEVRASDLSIDPGEHWPLADVTSLGHPRTYDEFRRQVWRSLLYHRPAHPLMRYAYIDGYQLVTLHFAEEGEPLQDMIDMDLLVLHVGVVVIPNRIFPAILGRVLHLRRTAGRPSWVWSPLPIGLLRKEFGVELLRALEVSESVDPSGSVRVPSEVTVADDYTDITRMLKRTPVVPNRVR